MAMNDQDIQLIAEAAVVAAHALGRKKGVFGLFGVFNRECSECSEVDQIGFPRAVIRTSENGGNSLPG